MKFQWFLGVSTILTFIPLFAQEITFLRSNEFKIQDPALAYSLSDIDVSKKIFEGLVQFKVDSEEIVPSLATSWEISGDLHSYTFKLRQNVTFHDGTPFTAEDVVASFLRQKKGNTPVDTWGYFYDLKMDKLIEKIETPAPEIVTFKLRYPDATFLATLAMHFVAIVPQKHLDPQTGILKNLIGTGPYSLKKATSSFVEIEKSKKYWDSGYQSPQKIIFQTENDPAKQLESLKNKKADLIVINQEEFLKEAQKISFIGLEKFNPNIIHYLAFETQKGPFASLELRKLLIGHLSTSSLMKSAFGELGVPSPYLIHPMNWAHTPSQISFEKKDLKPLCDAFHEKSFRVLFSAGSSIGPFLMEELKKILAPCSLKLVPEHVNFSQRAERVLENSYEIIIANWISDNGDPDNTYSNLFGMSDKNPAESNLARYFNPTLKETIAMAKMLPWQNERLKFYQQIQKHLETYWPVFPLGYTSAYYAFNKDKISSLKGHPLFLFHPQTIKLNEKK